jgi:hypothetical protein
MLSFVFDRREFFRSIMGPGIVEARVMEPTTPVASERARTVIVRQAARRSGGLIAVFGEESRAAMKSRRAATACVGRCKRRSASAMREETEGFLGILARRLNEPSDVEDVG